MATEGQLGGEGTLFVGEDKVLRLAVLDEIGVPVNFASWVVHFECRHRDDSKDPADLAKVATVVGTYNADPLLNTQRLQVILTDDDTNAMTDGRSTEETPHRYAWKRMDDGSETVLRYGDLVLQVSTVR